MTLLPPKGTSRLERDTASNGRFRPVPKAPSPALAAGSMTDNHRTNGTAPGGSTRSEAHTGEPDLAHRHTSAGAGDRHAGSPPTQAHPSAVSQPPPMSSPDAANISVLLGDPAGGTAGRLSPADEQARMAAVRRYDILDAPPDGAFDRICSIAARVFDVPMAVVSIVDEDRIWFLGRHGVEVDQVSRDPGLCASAIFRDDVTVLADTIADPVALTNPLVAGQFGLRFYAAAPIRTSEGHGLGTVCVLDTEPRRVTETEMATLVDLAAVVAGELEARLVARSVVAYQTELRRLEGDKAQRNERFAAALQATLIPLRLPSIDGVDLAALYRPADSSLVGGDFYDVFPVGQGCWGITIGDVCGKGVEAAVIAASARYAVRAAAVEHRPPSVVLSVVNAALNIDVAARAPDMGFCTVAYARLQPYRDGFRLSAASGGHPLPLLRRASGRIDDVGVPGMLLGAFPEPRVRDQSIFLRPGDTVVWFTDGLSEAPTPTGFSSRADVVAALRSNQTSAADVVEHLDTALSTPSVRQRDDTAIVALRVQRGRKRLTSGVST